MYAVYDVDSHKMRLFKYKPFKVTSPVTKQSSWITRDGDVGIGFTIGRTDITKYRQPRRVGITLHILPEDYNE